MILECPECRTRYLVPDTAIGVEGRTVRCANCRHSWFQEPAELDLAAAPPPPPEIAAAAPPPPVAGTGYAPPPVDYASSAYDAPSQDAPAYDAFAHQPPFRARRNPARRWTALAIAAGLLMLIGVGAILWSGSPGFGSRFGLSFASAETPLRLRDNPIERRELENGSELFAVSGQVLNPSATPQRIPDIRAQLRDADGKLVYSWTITPERRTLAAGGAIDFNSAKLDVPATSRRLELSFAGEN